MTILKISVACFGSNKGERDKGNDDFKLNSLPLDDNIFVKISSRKFGFSFSNLYATWTHEN